MIYEISRHALDVQKEREIDVKWIERVLQNPDFTRPDEYDNELEHRIGRIAEFGNRFLRVVVNVKVKPVRIVTVYFDRTVKGVPCA